MITRYAIVVAGELGEDRADIFAGLDISRNDGLTTIVGDLDQAALHGLLERVRTVGLDLVEVRRLHHQPTSTRA